jgi:hypothetical protein
MVCPPGCVNYAAGEVKIIGCCKKCNNHSHTLDKKASQM